MRANLAGENIIGGDGRRDIGFLDGIERVIGRAFLVEFQQSDAATLIPSILGMWFVVNNTWFKSS